ncbi:hypothetical protein [Thermus sp.]|uniref:hypothetical protein n=1 Tax=Thermus sp. TaxID=275 RepID=UPI00307E9B78
MRHVAILGNDPIPALLGLRLAQARGRVGEVILYAQEPWKGYEARREAFLKRLRDEGLPVDLRPLPDPRRFPEWRGEVRRLGEEGALFNLTGGPKHLAALFLEALKGTRAQVFLVEAHRPLEAPKALFLQGRALPLPEASLEDYLEVHLGPAGLGGHGRAIPPRFPKGAQGVDLGGGRWFVVYRGRPYLYAPSLGRGNPRREDMARLAGEARRLGGELALAVVPYPREALLKAHPKERDRRLATWRHWAQEMGVFLVEPEGPLAPSTAAVTANPALPEPEEGPVLLAAASGESAPLYGAVLAYRPQTLYLFYAPEMEERVAWAQEAFRDKGLRVHGVPLEGPWDHQGAHGKAQRVVEMVRRRGLTLHVHLNGGTRALALGLYRALGGLEGVHYLEEDRILELPQGERDVPWGKGRVEELLALRGYRLKKAPELGAPRPDGEVESLAKVLVRQWEQVEPAWDREGRVLHFFGLWNRRFRGRLGPRAWAAQKGLPLEYLAYVALERALAPLGGGAILGGRLVPLGDSGWGDDQVTQVDGLAYYKGQLWPVECKQDRGALADRADTMKELAKRLGGSRGRALLVVARWRGEVPPADPALIYLALEPKSLPEGVLPFPEGLGEVFR